MFIDRSRTRHDMGALLRDPISVLHTQNRARLSLAPRSVRDSLSAPRGERGIEIMTIGVGLGEAFSYEVISRMGGLRARPLSPGRGSRSGTGDGVGNRCSNSS